MIDYNKFQLDNGLTFLIHSDKTTPLVAFNVLYGVGSRDENPDKTGLAHLFEHLMFGGTQNIPAFDVELEKIGGENNAFTNNDITNYYMTLPAQNIEVAFWLESDRMSGFSFSENSFRVQQQVVCEEFKQRYLNQPYGDAWLLLKPLAYKKHPYLWSTIGKDLSHIENMTLEDARSFYNQFYVPSRAIISIAGNVDVEQMKILAEKWFSPISSTSSYQRKLPQEAIQNKKRTLTVERDVPSDKIYMAFPMCKRTHPNYYVFDLLSDILSNGESSRLKYNLTKKKHLFTDISAFVTGDFDEGLFVIAGTLKQGISFEMAEQAVWKELYKLQEEPIRDKELQKVKNKLENLRTFAYLKIIDKAMDLAYYELLGNAGQINKELGKYLAIEVADIVKTAQTAFTEEKSSVLYYKSKK